jgi:hypothetical protein
MKRLTAPVALALLASIGVSLSSCRRSPRTDSGPIDASLAIDQEIRWTYKIDEEQVREEVGKRHATTTANISYLLDLRAMPSSNGDAATGTRITIALKEYEAIVKPRLFDAPNLKPEAALISFVLTSSGRVSDFMARTSAGESSEQYETFLFPFLQSLRLPSGARRVGETWSEDEQGAVPLMGTKAKVPVHRTMIRKFDDSSSNANAKVVLSLRASGAEPKLNIAKLTETGDTSARAAEEGDGEAEFDVRERRLRSFRAKWKSSIVISDVTGTIEFRLTREVSGRLVAP